MHFPSRDLPLRAPAETVALSVWTSPERGSAQVMSGLALDVTSEESAGELRIQCSGEVLYASCGQLHQELQRWEEQAIRSLVVDCRSVRYLDSTGIAGLNRAARFAAAHGWSFTLRPSVDVERVLRMAGRADLIA